MLGVLNQIIKTCAVIIILLVTNLRPAFAEKRLPSSQSEINLSYASLVKRAAPAVVNIYTKRFVKSISSPFFNDPFFRQFFGENGHKFGGCLLYTSPSPRDRG